jgi:N-acetylglutamate synthase-like GNAT family acetyltransferase
MIRPAVDSDVPSVLNCLADAFAPYRNSYTAEAFLDTVLSAETIKHRMKNMKIFVAEVQTSGTIIGTVACNLVSPEEGHLRGMAVLNSCLGSGVAQQLLETAEAELRAQKCIRITLDTTEPLSRAINFYRRNGFRPSGRVTDFFGMPLYEYVKDLK